MIKRPKIGLALSGGGARGLAHIGVIKILEKEKIPIDIITGTSAGSIIGAMYAQNPSIEHIEAKMKHFFNSKEYKRMGMEYVVKKQSNENLFNQLTETIKERIVINIACSRKSMVNEKRIKIPISSLIEEGDIKDTKIKLGVAASDLVSGQGYYFVKGNIYTAIQASSSIPGFLPPVEINNKQLLDGVITDPVPIKLAFDMGADVVIAVDVSPDLLNKTDFTNIIEIMIRYNQMTGYAYNNILLEQADVVLRPNTGKLHWAEFKDIDDIIAEGEREAEKFLSKLKFVTKRRYLLSRKLKL